MWSTPRRAILPRRERPQGAGQSHLERLPVETLGQIYSFCDPRTAYNLQTTCSTLASAGKWDVGAPEPRQDNLRSIAAAGSLEEISDKFKELLFGTEYGRATAQTIEAHTNSVNVTITGTLASAHQMREAGRAAEHLLPLLISLPGMRAVRTLILSVEGNIGGLLAEAFRLLGDLTVSRVRILRLHGLNIGESSWLFGRFTNLRALEVSVGTLMAFTGSHASPANLRRGALRQLSSLRVNLDPEFCTWHSELRMIFTLFPRITRLVVKGTFQMKQRGGEERHSYDKVISTRRRLVRALGSARQLNFLAISSIWHSGFGIDPGRSPGIYMAVGANIARLVVMLPNDNIVEYVRHPTLPDHGIRVRGARPEHPDPNLWPEDLLGDASIPAMFPGVIAAP
ncbi:hypothetical protein F4818DRAFT_441659 [Hypoxylon cercidicola]|nr:hypothetical protein F4818DRAFT_441659 [Hypoxylon cercidicola]